MGDTVILPNADVFWTTAAIARRETETTLREKIQKFLDSFIAGE